MTKDWFVEKHTPHAGLTLAIKARLVDTRSAFQRIEVLDTHEYGRMLLLDGNVMLTERDEFIYHEMIAHPALLSHPDPRRVLIIGGGDGGSVREVLRHPGIEQVHLVEIDEQVIATSREWFPALSSRLDDPRVSIECRDGFVHLDEHAGEYDVILTDSMDPIGEAAKLFTGAFYEKVKAALRPGGCAVFQTESPFYSLDMVAQVSQDLAPLFANVLPYLAFIPTYPSGLWSFTFASDTLDPRPAALHTAAPQPKAAPQVTAASALPPFLADLKYLNAELLGAAFALPNYLRRRIAGQ